MTDHAPTSAAIESIRSRHERSVAGLNLLWTDAEIRVLLAELDGLTAELAEVRQSRGEFRTAFGAVQGLLTQCKAELAVAKQEATRVERERDWLFAVMVLECRSGGDGELWKARQRIGDHAHQLFESDADGARWFDHYLRIARAEWLKEFVTSKECQPCPPSAAPSASE